MTAGATPQIVRNAETSRFELADDPERAHLNYHVDGRRLTLVHTEVADELGGQGMGSALVRAAVDHAVDEGLVVVPVCPFVRSWLDAHPERADQLSIEEP